jgi:hypothetical protein
VHSRTRVLGALFLSALVMGPIAALLHELGHWIVAKAAGFQPTLHAYAVSGIPEAAPFGGNPSGVAAVALAGPAVTMLLTAVGYTLWRQDSSRSWTLALAFAAPTRLIINALFLIGSMLVVLGVAERSNPNFDEVTAASALDIPAVSLAIIGALVLPLTWWSIIRRLGQYRWVDITSLAAGTIIGMALWLGPVGDSLLP